ncbi:MAG: F0F1 ATP synthase subunit A [Chloroflexota bacterium]
MAETHKQTGMQQTGWRWGFKRWIVLAVIIGNYLAAKAFAPVLPHIQMAAEKVPLEGWGVTVIVLALLAALLILVVGLLNKAWEAFLLAGWLGFLAALPYLVPSFHWTNTLTGLVISMTVLGLIGLAVRRAVLSGEMVPGGVSGVIEFMLEAIYNITESTAGKWARTIFPFFATITLLVLVSNWTELFPIVDTIGVLEHAEHGHAVKELIPGVATIVKEEAEHGEGYTLIPFLRVTSTDLNFTVALALIAVVMTQVIGFRAQKFSYFTKFVNVKHLFTKPFFGALDFVVGLLELISELSKVISFAFRLFGNIFAGSVLLMVIGSLVPFFAQSGFLMLEFFVGAIQAIVFGMLTMVFMSQATQGHGDHEGEPAH